MPITRTPIIDDDGSGTTGTVLDNAWKQELYNQIDASAASAGGWTPYTPTWAGNDGIGPTLNNGSFIGRYALIGKTCHFVMRLQPGSTTSFGSSTFWMFSLPFAAADPNTAANACVAGMIGPTGGPTGPAIVYSLNPTSVYVISTSGGFVNPTTPFTWAAPNCVLTIRGTYETG